ncbi:tRNA (uracil-O(2)-)-methyltransferase [Hyphodiscus hymeniophilus]|uniref:tRNA (uracil-O(2)-)-methyltransferase n=1 Tax=Hyphodiscus hymeniophilus TaxID=353542 RepID=A0A9P7AZY5_9HELO|nr:tRNA (uracil-O(2)-)-methyltransferase [Hyphodiscus hymeniophilus]
MLSKLEPYSTDAPAVLEEISNDSWTPLFRHDCTFPPEIFREVMLNLIRNPNINSNHLFRADISLECPFTGTVSGQSEIPPQITHFMDYNLKTVMVRTMIPRNIVVDQPLDQTCLFYEQVVDSGETRSLVSYRPHISSPTESPFYHPAVRGIGFLHTYDPESKGGSVSIHYSFFDSEPRTIKLERTAQHLLAVLYKHGQGLASGYVKRVNHDVILPQATVQNTYSRLKTKYAKLLCQNWAETTDPGKHVFEDLGIAAFLIELWREMYKDKEFPGFIDIGCGNGLLVHILIEEGYAGWGFDARRRKSWSMHSPKARDSLKELVLIPAILQTEESEGADSDALAGGLSLIPGIAEAIKDVKAESDESNTANSTHRIHNGIFPKGTFIISNHADELTPWTPILANLSESPFMMIPCCSHALSGARFRAAAPKGSSSSTSAFSSLVSWVSAIASDCGWEVEKEMLRIPSTRNTALIGRRREISFADVNMIDVVNAHGGAAGWEENALKLVKGATRGH